MRASGSDIVGRTLGDFVVTEPLGEGGFGMVFRAEQQALGREAVVKVMRVEHRGSREASERFLREARLASRLDHPYAAHVYAFGAEPDGLLWIAMELVRGVSLERVIESQGPLSLERFAPLLERICEVVHSAHEHGIVHRDLKPANVMVLSHSGRLLPKLMDFGIAKARDVVEAAVEPASGVDASTVPLRAGDEDAALDATLDVASTPTIGVSSPSAGATVSAMTRQGAILGSPHYMAPEQWLSAGSVDRRADIYALGAVAYEALTGAPPFSARTLTDMARAHASLPVPSLGTGFPAELDRVIERALAKAPDARYQDALKLAQEFRRAAGLGDEAPLPRLHPDVRAWALDEAPEPLAEAASALERATNAHQGLLALRELARTIVRLLAIYALAARSRLPVAHGSMREAGLELVRMLRQRSLEDVEWLALARELVRTFAPEPEAHPLPGLVAFLGAPSLELERLCGLVGGQTRSVAEVARDTLADGIELLTAVLRSLAFLSSYPLVCASGDHVEAWMGTRRGVRSTLAAGRGRLPPDRPTLVDLDGAPVVYLDPMVRVAAPSPGAARELFLLDRPTRAGARLVVAVRGFELVDPSVWSWLSESVLASSALPDGGTVDESRAPFRGLAAFGPEDAELFAGRERERGTVINRLRTTAAVFIVGPSGAGKSSFVRAAVVPALERTDAVYLRPGARPCDALAGAAVAYGVEASSAPMAGIAELARARGRSVVIVVDQLEELFTLAHDDDERTRFVNELMSGARGTDDPVRVIATLRDDFLMHANRMPALREPLATGLQLLATPDRDELRRMLVEPLARCGHELDDPHLADEMVEAVADRPGALPLLSFTALQLWERRDRHFRRLTRAAYEQLGGVTGALAGHAEQTLAAMTTGERTTVRDVFRQLVTAEGTRVVSSRAELRERLGGGDSLDGVLAKLIAARLLVASEGDAEHGRIEVVHEALFSAWPRLVDWLREVAEGARVSDQLRVAARQWDDRGRPRGLLWRGDALMEFRLLDRRLAFALADLERAFVRASESDETRGRRLRRIAIATAVAGLLIATVTLYRANLRVDSARERALASEHESRARLVELHEEQGRQLWLQGDPMKALVYLSAAYREGADDAGLHYLLGATARASSTTLATLAGHADAVAAVAFSPDGARIATVGWDAVAKIWDSDSGRELIALRGHTASLRGLEITGDGRRVLTTSDDGSARMWDAETGRLLLTVNQPGRGSGMVTATLSSDGARLLTASPLGGGALWDATSGRVLHSWPADGVTSYSAAFDREQHRVVLAAGRTARVFDAATGALVFATPAATGEMVAARFSPTGALVTGSDDGAVQIWDAATSRPIAAFRAGRGLRSLAVSPDGALIAVGLDSGLARVYDASSVDALATLVGHKGWVWSVAFSPDGTRVATGSSDATARVWEARSGRELAVLVGHLDTVFGAVFSPDGKRIVTASADHTARIWSAIHDDALVRIRSASWLWNAAFSPDGSRIATANAAGVVEVWDARTGERQHALSGHQDAVYGVAFSPDGRRLISAGKDGTARVWDVASGDSLRILRVGAVCRRAVIARDERVFVASEDGYVRGFDASGALLGEADAGIGALADVELAPGERELVVAGASGRALVMTTELHQRLELDGHHLGLDTASMSLDGALVVTSSDDKTARIRSARTGELVAVLSGHTNQINSAAFSPDGAYVVTASYDGYALLWATKNGKLLGPVGRKGDPVTWAVFSPDGAQVLASSADGTAAVWSVVPERRGPEAVAADVACRDPYRLEREQLVPAAPTCAGR